MTTPHPYQEAIDELEAAKTGIQSAKEAFQEGLMDVAVVEDAIEAALSILIGPPPSPSITVAPAVGAPGTRVTVHGFNFTPDARAFILAAAVHMFSPTVRADGEFHGEFTLPTFIPSGISISVVYESDPTTIIASAPFMVTQAPPPPPPPPNLVVSDFKVSTNRGDVDTAGLSVGRLVYTDRSYTYTAPIPTDLTGGVLIRTANEDSNNISANYITFKVNLPVNAFVLVDEREVKQHDSNGDKLPAWLTDWSRTDMIVNTTEVHGKERRAFQKSFPAGTVTLPGPGSEPNNWTGSNMTAVVKAA